MYYINLTYMWYFLHCFFSLPACDKGYTGHNCEDVCPFPSYGLDCQSICNCAETQCNPVNGCNGYLTGFVNKKKYSDLYLKNSFNCFQLILPFFLLLNFSVEKITFFFTKWKEFVGVFLVKIHVPLTSLQQINTKMKSLTKNNK